MQSNNLISKTHSQNQTGNTIYLMEIADTFNDIRYKRIKPDDY